MLAEQLILHVLIVLTPFLIYSVFYENKKIGRMNILLGILNGLAATFVMFFPIYSHGLYFDLRYVPLIIATLYGGPLSGGIVLIMILLKRTLMGGDALIFGYIGAILGILLPLLLYKTFLKCPPRMRVGIAILVGVWPTVFNLLISYYNVGRTLEGPAFIDRIQDLLILGAIQTIAIGFVAILTEIIFERNEIRDKIQRTEKLNTLGELAASIAHEVRNPLTVVKGFLQLMKQEEVGKKQEYFTLVLTELGRAEQIINDYLNFAKPKLENIEILKLNTIIDDVWHLLEPMAVKEGIQLEYDNEHPFYLKTDRNQLKQALVNIIKNAIEATPDGGKISI
ncbi:sporulation sensor histidine kinase KinB [Bacillus carboniphilus]|uniref:histidine kinase n=1 Tax=Bacillus carboniphilus TaxID=86663 RepID=A0ABN0W3G8_9BACI